jgi:hypothetical protein
MLKVTGKKYLKTTSRICIGVISGLVFFNFIVGINFLYGQNSTSSPYSRFGVGDLNATSFARNLGMGGTEIGLNQPGFINYGNPASYANLSYTTYEGGLVFKQFEFKTSKTQHHTNTASVAYFDFAFPIKPQRWGIGFGLIPYSEVGYLVTAAKTNAFGDTEINQYEGSGGLNNFHIGSGYKISKKLSVGINAEYLFGIIDNNRIVAYTTPYYLNTAINSSTSVGWFHFQGGLQYRMDSLRLSKSDSIVSIEKNISALEQSLKNLINLNSGDTTAETYSRKNQLARDLAAAKLMKESVLVKKVKSNWHLVLGLIVAPTADLHARNSQVISSFRYKVFSDPGFGILVRDTVINIEGERSFIRLPFRTGLGFSLLKGSKWLFCGDYSFQKWSEFTFLGASDSLVDSWKVTAGIQYTPNDRLTNAFFKTIQYRIGFHYESGYIKLNGINISEIGLSAGFSMPIRKAGSYIHIALEGGRRGTTKNDLIEERYFKLTAGFTINDRWFIKSKYD